MKIFEILSNQYKKLSYGINPAKWPETLTTSIIIILVAFGSFGLGRLSRIEEGRSPLTVRGMEANLVTGNTAAGRNNSPVKDTMASRGGEITHTGASNGTATAAGGFIVGSKTGKKYHFPWCSGAQQIKEENKVWFANEEEARAAGFAPAANCRGLGQ